MSLVDRVAVEARKFKLVALLLWLLSAPFYVIGIVVGLLWVAGSFAVAAVRVGMADAKARARSGGGG